MFLHLGCK